MKAQLSDRLWMMALLLVLALPGLLGKYLHGWQWYSVASLYGGGVLVHLLIEIVKAFWRRWGASL